MNKQSIINTLALLVFLPNFVLAESATDFLRSTGKIYSVVLVIVLLFLGIVLLLIRLERRISKLEKSNLNE